MKLIFAAAAVAMLTVPAYAQSQGRGAPPQPPAAAPKSPQEIEAERAAEQAYKKSLGNIPDQPAADPWGSARGVDASRTAAKTPAAGKKPQSKTGSNAN
jgi:hypothetical protein